MKLELQTATFLLLLAGVLGLNADRKPGDSLMIVTEEFELDFGNDVDMMESLVSYPPPNNKTFSEVEASCNCKQILVSSLNEAQHIQPGSMGVYKYYQMFNSKVSYYGPQNQRLYFLNGSGWLIGPTIGSPTGYVHNSNQYECPYLIPSGWMYVNNGYWYNDSSLVIRCIQ